MVSKLTKTKALAFVVIACLFTALVPLTGCSAPQVQSGVTSSGYAIGNDDVGYVSTDTMMYQKGSSEVTGFSCLTDGESALVFVTDLESALAKFKEAMGDEYPHFYQSVIDSYDKILDTMGYDMDGFTVYETDGEINGNGKVFVSNESGIDSSGIFAVGWMDADDLEAVDFESMKSIIENNVPEAKQVIIMMNDHKIWSIYANEDVAKAMVDSYSKSVPEDWRLVETTVN